MSLSAFESSSPLYSDLSVGSHPLNSCSQPNSCTHGRKTGAPAGTRGGWLVCPRSSGNRAHAYIAGTHFLGQAPGPRWFLRVAVWGSSQLPAPISRRRKRCSWSAKRSCTSRCREVGVRKGETGDAACQPGPGRPGLPQMMAASAAVRPVGLLWGREAARRPSLDDLGKAAWTL